MSTATVCRCPRCTIEREGVSGPFTPEEFKALGLGQRVVSPTQDDAVASDPGVLAATLALREARAAWEPVHEAWEQASLARRRAEADTGPPLTDGRGGLFRRPGRSAAKLPALKAAEKDALEARELAWRPVTRTHDDLRRAQHAARMRAAQAPSDAGVGV